MFESRVSKSQEPFQWTFMQGTADMSAEAGATGHRRDAKERAMSKQGSVDDRPLFRSGSGAAQFRDAGISADFSPWQATTRLPSSFIMANGRNEKGEIMT